ncbi:MAG: hypothetical protein KBG00_12290 [Rhodoferax sp.]|uniref:hypothetical protein n=1 Tax=Rhodoferax sp. TaxID=50421 RepID=UPI001B410533|nr:hypothetical protein [Rhodoferax sp.]MBP9149549.1 hypothetical protein [Rhodoferax sp.]MBP9734375.1 hypothetical protein [Rhodoferax sp.]
MKAWFQRVVLRRTWLCFVVMGLGFFAFGLGTLNLIYIARANATLLMEHGWQAMMDGGLLQLVEILLTGYASLAAYIVFKACEHKLALGLSEGH